MGFYDSYNFDGLSLLSGITAESKPSEHFLTAIKQLKDNTPPPESLTVAEIGIGNGATTLATLLMLDEGDVYYAFDFEDYTTKLMNDLQARDFGIKCKVIGKGNSRKVWDSYNWNLSNMVFEMRKRKETGFFDAVYLDGAHTLIHDGLAICLLKELIKEGGYLVLDDLFWSWAGSPSCRPLAERNFPKEQVEAYQVLRAQELFLTNDPNWEKLSDDKSWRGVFRKRSG